MADQQQQQRPQRPAGKPGPRPGGRDEVPHDVINIILQGKILELTAILEERDADIELMQEMIDSQANVIAEKQKQIVKLRKIIQSIQNGKKQEESGPSPPTDIKEV